MLDWGDTGVGQPLLDLPSFLEDRLGVGRGTDPRATGWTPGRPRCRAATAARRRTPGPGRGRPPAMIYQTFVDNIEPVERRHHDADVIEWLARTAVLARAEKAPDEGDLSPAR